MANSSYGTRLFIVFVCVVLQAYKIQAENYTLGVFLTDPNPTRPDTYLNEVKELPKDKTYYIVGFEPTVTMDVVHHMVVSVCQDVKVDGGELYCDGYTSYMYAWARNAPALYLPEGVGFKIGKDGYKGISLQLHFSDVSNLKGKNMQKLGVRLLYTDVKQPKIAGVFILGAGGGEVKPNQTETFDISCQMKDDVHMHIFAFRPHTHHLGRAVAGYRVRTTSDGKDDWTLIGKQNPQKPQRFYPSNPVVVEKGDTLAARCTMLNDKDHTISIGSTSHDEMCNFYAMFWVDDGRFPRDHSCWSYGPPNYYWDKDPSFSHVPIDSNVID